MPRRKSILSILFAALSVIWIAPAGAEELRVLVKDQAGQPLEDAVVLATPADGRNVTLPIQARNEIDQINQEFVPHVMVVTVGSKVYFPNKDNIRHHVYSFSPAKVFELPLYSGHSASPVLFDKAGLVTLGCNIHDWMLGYVYVANTPYFGKSAKDGRIIIAGIPPGEYVVRIWHPDMKDAEESTQRKVKLGAATPETSMEWQLPVKQVFKIPRASARSGATYH